MMTTRPEPGGHDAKCAPGPARPALPVLHQPLAGRAPHAVRPANPGALRDAVHPAACGRVTAGCGLDPWPSRLVTRSRPPAGHRGSSPPEVTR